MSTHISRMHDNIVLLASNSNFSLAQKVANELNMPLTKVLTGKFNDGELYVKLQSNVKDKHVFLIHSMHKTGVNSINDSIMEFYLIARTLKRALAKTITAIIPYYAYARQNRAEEPNQSIAALDMAKLIESSGINQLIAIDLHCDKIQSFFHKAVVENLLTSCVSIPYFKNLNLKKSIVVSPDLGGVHRAKKFSTALALAGIKTSFVMLNKKRVKHNRFGESTNGRRVKGRDAIIVDDIVDTGTTLIKTAIKLKKLGALNIYANITHPVFSLNAIERLENSLLTQIIVTDSLPLPIFKLEKIIQLSLAQLLAEKIKQL